LKNDAEDGTSMPKISGRNIAMNNQQDKVSKIKKLEPNPIDQDIFINAK
jgi:hypothetical protein